MTGRDRERKPRRCEKGAVRREKKGKEKRQKEKLNSFY
jgi:hypothetical protein